MKLGKLSEIKKGFIDYLQKLEKKEQEKGNNILHEDFNDDTFSLFDHASEFKKYLQSKAYKYSININQVDLVAASIFKAISGGSDEGLEDETSSKDSEKSDEKLENTTELYSDLFGDENMVGIFDSDKSGELSQDEIAFALTNIGAIDGTNNKVSLKDFAGLSNYIKAFQKVNPNLGGDEFKTALLDSIKALDGDSDNLTIDDFTLINSEEAKLANQDYAEMGEDGSAIPESEKPTSLNTHESNYKGPDGQLKSNELTAGVISLDGEIAELEKQIEEQNELKAKAAEASKEYFEQNQYKEKLSNLNTLISNINDYNSQITTLEADLHTIEYNLNAAEAELANLSDATVFTEYQQGIDKRREELNGDASKGIQGEIEKLKENKAKKETELKEAEANLKQANDQREALEGEIAEIEANNPDEESRQVIAQCNENIGKLKEAIGDKERETGLQGEKAKKEKELNTQRNQEKEDAKVFGAAQAYRQSEFVKFMMDYAINPATKKKYDEAYFNGSGAYCAVFTSEVSEKLYAEVLKRLGFDPSSVQYGDTNADKALRTNQMSMSAAPWGNNIQSVLNSLGLNAQGTIDVTGMSDAEKADLVRSGKVYPGMTWEYKHYENGQLVYHTGFVESINQDLSWNTIEGNTTVKYSDGKSEDHTVGSHKRDGFKPYLSSFTDSTLKALIWAYEATEDPEKKEKLKNLVYSSYYSHRGTTDV